MNEGGKSIANMETVALESPLGEQYGIGNVSIPPSAGLPFSK